jgi:hypothetical protein
MAVELRAKVVADLVAAMGFIPFMEATGAHGCIVSFAHHNPAIKSIVGRMQIKVDNAQGLFGFGHGRFIVQKALYDRIEEVLDDKLAMLF